MNGIDMIAAERLRQVEEEGWTPENDDCQDEGQLALAAACYASPELLFREVRAANGTSYVDPWPWDSKWDKRAHAGNTLLPSDPFHVNIHERMRQLAKAGALVAAELDRLLRRKEDL